MSNFYKDKTGKTLPEGVVRLEWRDQCGHVVEMPEVDDPEVVQERKEIYARYNGLIYRYAVREGSKSEPREDYEEQSKKKKQYSGKQF
jgi:hypothetical protein